MGKAGRVVVGLGIVTLGVCAALPFQRPEIAVVDPSTGTTPASGLQVRGVDVPDASLERLPVLAIESSPGADATNAAAASGSHSVGAGLPEGRETGAAQATTPTLRLDHPTAVPRIAESFSEAIEHPQSAGTSLREPLAERSVPPTVPACSLEAEVAEANSLPLRPGAGPVRLGAPVAWSNAIRHRIRDGDTLPDLARRYLGDAGRAREIFEANRQVLSRPDVLPLGQVLRIPARGPASGG